MESDDAHKGGPPSLPSLPSVRIFGLSASYLCAFASLADVAKGGDGAKSALREICLLFVIFCSLSLGGCLRGFRGIGPVLVRS